VKKRTRFPRAVDPARVGKYRAYCPAGGGSWNIEFGATLNAALPTMRMETIITTHSGPTRRSAVFEGISRRGRTTRTDPTEGIHRRTNSRPRRSCKETTNHGEASHFSFSPAPCETHYSRFSVAQCTQQSTRHSAWAGTKTKLTVHRKRALLL